MSHSYPRLIGHPEKQSKPVKFLTRSNKGVHLAREVTQWGEGSPEKSDLIESHIFEKQYNIVFLADLTTCSCHQSTLGG